MNNFYLVESPLQYINAVEAKKALSNSSDINKLIVLEGVSSINLQQIESLIDQKIWNSVTILRGTQNRWKYKRLISELNELLTDNIGIVCIGEYRSILMRHFANKSKTQEIFLLDDGNYSLLIQKNLLNNEGEYRKYNPLRKLYDKLLKIADGDIFRIKFYSVYKLNITETNKDRFIFNQYQYLKSMQTDKTTMNAVYFVGNITPELNIFSSEYYLRSLKSVFSYYAKQGLEVKYLPHRREDPVKLEHIQEEMGVQVLKFGIPIELVLLNSQKLPVKVASFYSSALDNCYHLYGDFISIDAFSIESKEIKMDEYIERIKLNYETYETYDSDSFNIIGLQDYI